LYAFSRENWARSPIEVDTLLGLLGAAVRDETPELAAQGVRVLLLGRLDELPQETRTEIAESLDLTAAGRRMTLGVAFNYSGRSELVDAARRCLADGLAPEAIDEETIAARLYTAGLPDPDLLIRTGGDQRISNFLIWQAAYAELHFSDRLWPDFDAPAFDEALADYARRSRRFGR
jgi:undecaprenyl diphosphate synthase